MKFLTKATSAWSAIPVVLDCFVKGRRRRQKSVWV